MFYNYIRLIKELYEIMEEVEPKYESTIRIMLDECVMHFFQAHSIPFEKQGEFLATMLYDCPKVQADYKTKKFTY